MDENKRVKCVRLFAAVVSLSALANGLSASIYNNYFSDVYQITAFQRGLLETPRESGGFLCALLFLLFGALGDVTLGIGAQLLMVLGLLVMAFLSPSYGVMILFLFLYSLGDHLFMPINDSVSMSLAKNARGGTSMGYFKKYSYFFSMLSGAAVFIGFRTKIFSFHGPVILPFAIAMALYLTTAVLLVLLRREMPYTKVKENPVKLRREYLPYYLTTLAFGCQKRIRIVFAPWILIELLHKGSDTTALLLILSKLVSSVVSPRIGKLLDRFGVKLSMRIEAFFMIVVFTGEGLFAGAVAAGKMDGALCVAVACVFFILSYLTDQFQMVHSLLMRQLAGDRKEEVTASLSMGVTVDHLMAVAISPLLGYFWTSVSPALVFFTAALSALIQLAVSKWMIPEKQAV